MDAITPAADRYISCRNNGFVIAIITSIPNGAAIDTIAGTGMAALIMIATVTRAAGTTGITVTAVITGTTDGV